MKKTSCICGACCERQCACPNADWETVDETKFKALLLEAYSLLGCNFPSSDKTNLQSRIREALSIKEGS